MNRNSKMFDLLIAGNGAVGLACALAVARQDRSFSIAVIGPGCRAGGASVAAGAMLGCHAEITAHALSTDAGQEKLSLAWRAKALWKNWLGQLADLVPAPETISGTFVISNALSSDLEDENFVAILRQLSKDGVAHELVEPGDVPGLRPTMDARPFHVVHIPDEDAIDAIAYINAMEAALKKLSSVKFIDERVTALRLKSDGQIEGVRISNGANLDAEIVLLAAGVGCQELIDGCTPLAGRIPRIFAGVGSSLLADQPLEPIRQVVRTPNRAFACGLHVVPRGKKIYIGATNTIREGRELTPRLIDIQFLLDSAIPQINEGLHRCLLQSTATGLRPVAADQYPLIGQTSVKGLYIATGTYRDGVTLSPLLAQDFAARISGAPQLVSSMFKPERQPLWTLNLEEAVALCVKHFVSVYYENGCRLPKVGWEEFLTELLRNEIQNIFREHRTERLPPIDFIHLMRQLRKSGAKLDF